MCAVLLPIGGRRPPLQHETKKLDAFDITDRCYTIVPLKLDFAAHKKGEWPSRPCGEWSTFRTLASRTKGADRSTQAVPPARRAYGSARRAVPLY